MVTSGLQPSAEIRCLFPQRFALGWMISPFQGSCLIVNCQWLIVSYQWLFSGDTVRRLPCLPPLKGWHPPSLRSSLLWRGAGGMFTGQQLNNSTTHPPKGIQGLKARIISAPSRKGRVSTSGPCSQGWRPEWNSLWFVLLRNLGLLYCYCSFNDLYSDMLKVKLRRSHHVVVD